MAKRGTSYGVATEIEIEVAKIIVDAFPAIDQVRMVNSGTEATMSALRVARGYTNRNKILKSILYLYKYFKPLHIKSKQKLERLSHYEKKIKAGWEYIPAGLCKSV